MTGGVRRAPTGDVARKAAVRVSLIRYYEDIGLGPIASTSPAPGCVWWA
jgi:hypothetical protein